MAGSAKKAPLPTLPSTEPAAEKKPRKPREIPPEVLAAKEALAAAKATAKDRGRRVKIEKLQAKMAKYNELLDAIDAKIAKLSE